MLVNVRSKIKLVSIAIVFFGVEGHQLKLHGQQSYLREINDKGAMMANSFWDIRDKVEVKPN